MRVKVKSLKTLLRKKIDRRYLPKEMQKICGKEIEVEETIGLGNKMYSGAGGYWRKEWLIFPKKKRGMLF